MAGGFARADAEGGVIDRRFPIQGRWKPGGGDPYGDVPWAVAELAYAAYSARYGRDQSLERLAERGGFGHEEMDQFAPGWREHFRPRPRAA